MSRPIAKASKVTNYNVMKIITELLKDELICTEDVKAVYASSNQGRSNIW